MVQNKVYDYMVTILRGWDAARCVSTTGDKIGRKK